MALLKDKYKVRFLKRINDTPTFIGQRIIKPNSETVEYRKKSYPIDTSKCAYRFKNQYIFLVDVDEGQLPLGKSQMNVSTSLIDLVVRQSIGKQLVSGLEKGSTLGITIMQMIIYICLGLAVGYIIGQFLPFPVENGDTGLVISWLG